MNTETKTTARTFVAPSMVRLKRMLIVAGPDHARVARRILGKRALYCYSHQGEHVYTKVGFERKGWL